MRAGFYSPYLDTYGGGERYILTIASMLSQKINVDLFWSDPQIKAPLSRFLKIDLSKVNIKNNIFEKKSIQKAIQTKKYDLIFILSDGSIPFSFAKKNIIHFQVPFVFDKPSRTTKLKISRYEHVICNSFFTKKFIDRSFEIDSQVIYPPVDLKSLKVDKKEKIIMSVGRFSKNQLHPKKQEVLIEVFKELSKKNKDWKLILAGQAKKEDLSYIKKIKREVKGYAIHIKENLDNDELRRLYAKCSIYWHATGFGEDEAKHPERMEHFGIATIEASASGAVPVVIGKGGQKEIITNRKNGLLWHSKHQLLEATQLLIDNNNTLLNLSQNAIKNSKKYSLENFYKEYEKIIF